MKTARFSEVVARSGRPEIHLTWTAPAADRVLQAAAKHSRVLTVHQRVRGAKKDFAVVGIEAEDDVQFLVFPKSLRPFAGRRIVGVRYELLADAVSMGTKTARPPRRGRSKPEPGFKPAVAEEFPDPPAPKIPASPTAVAKSQPEPIAFEQAAEDLDPLKAEIRRAVTDLSVGEIAKAKRRLIALLRG